MADLLTLLTSTGTLLSNKSGHDILPITGTGNASAGALMPDSKQPSVWLFDITNNLVEQIDIYSKSKTVKSFGSGYFARSVQADPVAGNVLVLRPYNPSGGSSNMSTIFVATQSTLSSGEFNVFFNTAAEGFFFAMDMKLDWARRRLWVADTGNNRVVGVNVDNQRIERVFDVDGMVCPSTLTFDENSGDVFARAYDRNMNLERIYHFNYDAGLVGSYDIPADFSWSVEMGVDWLSPTQTSLAQIVSLGLSIPFPLTGSMDFDHLRSNLWWVSNSYENSLYLLNTETMTGTSADLSIKLRRTQCVSSDLESGDAFVGGSAILTSGGLLRVSQTDFGEMQTVLHASISINQIIPLRGSNETLPFSVTGTVVGQIPSPVGSSSSQSEDESSSSSSSSTSSSSSGADVLYTINSDLIRTPEKSGDIIVPHTGVSTPSNLMDFYVWAEGSEDVTFVKSGVIPGMPYDQFMTPDRFLYLPVFSWTSTPYLQRSVLVASMSDGSFEKVMFDGKSIVSQGSVKNATSGTSSGMSTSKESSLVYVGASGVVTTISVANSGNYPADISGRSSYSGIYDLSPQYHTKSGSLWCLSKSRGTVLVIPDISNINNRGEYGVFDAPFKMIWSNQHGSFLVSGQNCLYVFDGVTHESESKYALDGFENTDFDVSSNGLVAVASESLNGSSVMVKILGLDLYDIVADTVVAGASTGNVGFLPQGNLVFSSEQIGSGRTDFALMDVATGTVSNLVTGISGSVVSMIPDTINGCVFAVMSSGRVVKATQTGAVSVGVMGDGVVLASGNIVELDVGTVLQTKARIFVGSRSGASDRWDSGVIETNRTAILYGGGNNLEPGQRYWVNIAVYHEGSGWSAPFETDFVVPIS